MNAAPPLILFDIDGTLLHPGPLPRRFMSAALSKAAHRQIELTLVDVLGKTDRSILKTALLRAGISPSKVAPLARAAEEIYLEMMRREYPRQGNTGHLIPGVREFLERAAQQYRLGLVTGNLEANAFLKLRAFGLDQFFSQGAFGENGEDRGELVKHALSLWDGAISNIRAVLFGDTPLDLRAAKTHGLGCVLINDGREISIGQENSPSSPPDLIISDYKDSDFILTWLERYFAQPG